MKEILVALLERCLIKKTDLVNAKHGND